MRLASHQAKYEREHGSKLRIMLFSGSPPQEKFRGSSGKIAGATLVAQYLGILLVDGFLSLGSLVFRGCSVKGPGVHGVHPHETPRMGSSVGDLACVGSLHQPRLADHNIPLQVFEGFSTACSCEDVRLKAHRSVWAYMWLMLESVFLASCGMFEPLGGNKSCGLDPRRSFSRLLLQIRASSTILPEYERLPVAATEIIQVNEADFPKDHFLPSSGNVPLGAGRLAP